MLTRIRELSRCLDGVVVYALDLVRRERVCGEKARSGCFGARPGAGTDPAFVA
ncbi:hypothetical protein [Saltatorellus ferox]|uniref:hypothetical protein n=1 Tax=Saltatorellus ferox TaxID=2528018 RepID=UPI003AF39438